MKEDLPCVIQQVERDSLKVSDSSPEGHGVSQSSAGVLSQHAQGPLAKAEIEEEIGRTRSPSIEGRDSEKLLTKLTHRGTLTLVASVVNYGITLLVGFFVNPVLVTLLGSSLFGTWKICQRLLAHVSGMDGQPTQALQWTIANKQSSADIAPKRRDIGCALMIWVRFLPLVLIIGSLVSWFSPRMIHGLPAEQFTATRLTCGILVLNLILQPLNNIPQAILRGMNLSYRGTWLRSIGAILRGFFMLAIAYLGWGLGGLASAVLFTSILTGFFVLIVVKRSFPWFGVSRPRKKEVRSFFSFSIWVFASAIFNKFMLSSDIVILGLVSSAALVTSFVLSTYTLQMTMGLVILLVYSALPGLGGLFGRNDFKKAARVRGEIMIITWLFTVSMGSVILLWNYSFVKLWIGQGNFVGFTENLLLVLMMTQLIFIQNDARIIDITLNIRKKVLLGFFSTTLAVILAYVFALFWHSKIVGLVTGLMAGRMVLTITYPILVEKALMAYASFAALKLLRPFLLMTALYAGTSILGTHLIAENWLRLILYGGGSFVFIFIIAFYLGLNLSQRKQIFIRMAHIGVPGFRNS